ncbi:signal peptidase I [Alloscardovia macacae]|nr:signal peptidase I [Alloscardovia macacae]
MTNQPRRASSSKRRAQMRWSAEETLRPHKAHPTRQVRQYESRRSLREKAKREAEQTREPFEWAASVDYIPHHSTGERILTKRDRRVLNALDFTLYFIVPLVVLLVLRFVVFGLFIIPSGSMENTLMVGDRIITRNIGVSAQSLQRGDVIVFSDDSHWLSESTIEAAASATHNFGIGSGKNYLVKRLIGMPGDVVASEGHGAPVTVNGVALDESAYLKSGVQPSEQAFSVTVPAGSVFVLGDNRANSADSRYHLNDGNSGCVRFSSITGIGMAVFWPYADWKTLNNGRAVFESVGL